MYVLLIQLCFLSSPRTLKNDQCVYIYIYTYIHTYKYLYRLTFRYCASMPTVFHVPRIHPVCSPSCLGTCIHRDTGRANTHIHTHMHMLTHAAAHTRVQATCTDGDKMTDGWNDRHMDTKYSVQYNRPHTLSNRMGCHFRCTQTPDMPPKAPRPHATVDSLHQ